MKKTSLLVCILLVFALLLSACGGTQAPANEPAQEPAAEPAQEPANEPAAEPAQEPAAEPSAEPSAELPAYKIGLITFSNEGEWFAKIYDAVNEVASNLNCEIVYTEGSGRAIEAVEEMIAADVDAILSLCTASVTNRLVEICAENEVYFSSAWAVLTQDEGYDEFVKNEYFAGNVFADDAKTAAMVAERMVADGASKVALYGLPLGTSASMDMRIDAAVEVFEANNVEIIADVRSYNLAEAAQNLLSQYSDVDCIYSSVEVASYLNQLLIQNGYANNILVNTNDDGGDVGAGFENGVISYACDGANQQAQLSFILLYNALTGHRMADANGAAPDVETQYVFCTSADEWANWLKFTTGGNTPYTFEECTPFISVLTESASAADIVAAAEAFSITDLEARHG